MALEALHDALNGDGTLFKALCGGLWKAAVDISNESLETDNHTNRLAWAETIFANRKEVARGVLVPFLQNATMAADPHGAAMTLAEYDNAVSYVIGAEIMPAVIEGQV